MIATIKTPSMGINQTLFVTWLGISVMGKVVTLTNTDIILRSFETLLYIIFSHILNCLKTVLAIKNVGPMTLIICRIHYIAKMSGDAQF